MSRAEVWAELSHARASVTVAQDRRLHALGIPTEARMMCGAARIQPEGRFYQPDDAGIMAVITPIIDIGEVVDLLAWTTDFPARGWTRIDAHWALGADALDRLWLAEPLLVFKSPLAWHQANAPYSGLVVLNWDVARHLILDIDIFVTDIEFGRELDQRLTVPARRPRVYVPKRAA